MWIFDIAGQSWPIKEWSRVGLASRGDVRMSGECRNGVMRYQAFDQFIQLLILRVFKRQFVATFELDADREVIAAFASVPVRDAGVPGALVAGYELDHRAVSPDQKVCRYSECAYPCKVGVGSRIERVGEEALDVVAAELRGGQADGVDYDQ